MHYGEAKEFVFGGKHVCLHSGIPTLVGDLENWPEHFLLLLAFTRGILSVFELVLKFEKSVFNTVAYVSLCALEYV